jgi:hypothetical protein
MPRLGRISVKLSGIKNTVRPEVVILGLDPIGAKIIS